MLTACWYQSEHFIPLVLKTTMNQVTVTIYGMDEALWYASYYVA